MEGLDRGFQLMELLLAAGDAECNLLLFFETRVQRLGLLIELGGVLVIEIDGAGMGRAGSAVEEPIGEFKINGRQLVAPAGRQQPGRFAFVDFTRLLIVPLANQNLGAAEPRGPPSCPSVNVSQDPGRSQLPDRKV